jgi:hypothetical protein
MLMVSTGREDYHLPNHWSTRQLGAEANPNSSDTAPRSGKT